jgi:aminoglycoside phosphotransferase (APT) family kinase protein
VPEQGPAAIVHGDYRLDNCILTPDGEIAAVLDWELCTLGDPLADVGLLLVYWAQRDDRMTAALEATTALEGFPTRDELVALYAAASGRDVSDVDYYVAFGYWKLACILEGVYARYRGGVMGEASGFEGFAVQVEMLANRALAVVEGLASP